jgi:hypothetical protein
MLPLREAPPEVDPDLELHDEIQRISLEFADTGGLGVAQSGAGLVHDRGVQYAPQDCTELLKSAPQHQHESER